MKRYFTFLSLVLLASLTSCAQLLDNKKSFTLQDTLRGTITPERAWWDVQRYDITVTPDYNTKTIKGKTSIQFKKTSNPPAGNLMQIDLQSPMVIDSMIFNAQKLSFTQDKNVAFVDFSGQKISEQNRLHIYFHGTPRAAKNAPWDGGWIWKKDSLGRPWMSVAVQGLGASAWFPCKDHQSDEPDSGASLTINVPDTLVAVANGKLKNKILSNGIASYTWEVTNPINNYNIVPYIGKYVNFSETYKGEKGALTCSYWVLDYNLEKAKKQFAEVPRTLKAFEHWFGAFPWYEDDFKLVEAPHLGMEHQSAVAYGNKFQNGYLGNDLSGTGIGTKWDFIIVHEVGHEWFGNNITTKDIADMWVHEGFTSYSETLFSEYHFGKELADKYVQGIRRNIQNKTPIIGTYGVNSEGSGDMYYKGSNMIHTIRQIIDNDEKFRSILRGLNKTFYHQTVTSKQIEAFINKQSGKDFSKVFDQYLRKANIPTLVLTANNGVLNYKWEDCVPQFDMPVKLTNGKWLHPTTEMQQTKLENSTEIKVDPNFYINIKK